MTMSGNEQHRRMDVARIHADLSVQELWLRYVALGGSGDAFDLDGYLQGLVPLETFQQDVLAQALNEALQESCSAYHVPLSTPPQPADGRRLDRLVDELLADRSPASPPEPEEPDAGLA